MGKFIDLTGQRYGKALVMSQAEDECLPPDFKKRKVRWLCLCDCGQEFITRANSLRSGNTVSCGCGQKEAATKTIRAWNAGARCENLHSEQWGMTFRDWRYGTVPSTLRTADGSSQDHGQDCPERSTPTLRKTEI